MTFEQLDRSIDADSDSDDDIAEQAHLYRSKCIRALRIPNYSVMRLRFVVATLNAKGKDTADADAPSDSVAGLSIEPSPPPQPRRPSAPPRPSAQSKPVTPLARALQAQRAPPPPDDDNGEDEDENDPFADRNAVTTPKVERGEPRWT
jgi:LAS seventeen-binding protein 5